MSLEGIVQNGVIVPQGECSLPEGSRVRIEPVEQNGQVETVPSTPRPNVTGVGKYHSGQSDGLQSKPGPTSLGDRLRELAKKYESLPCDLPEDFAINHDHYIHGAPKRT